MPSIKESSTNSFGLEEESGFFSHNRGGARPTPLREENEISSSSGTSSSSSLEEIEDEEGDGDDDGRFNL